MILQLLQIISENTCMLTIKNARKKNSFVKQTYSIIMKLIDKH